MNNLSEPQFGPKNFMSLEKPVFSRIGMHVNMDPETEDEHEWELEQNTRPGKLVDLPSHVTLHTFQRHIDRAGIRGYINNPYKPDESDTSGSRTFIHDPIVYKLDGAHWIYEGHHRIAASRLKGEPSLKVHMFDLDS
jgi:hypothetical protein